MSFFDNKITVEKTVRDIMRMNYNYKNELSNYDFSADMEKIKDEEILSEIILKIVRANQDVSTHMKQIRDMYSAICIDQNKASEKNILFQLIDLYLKREELFENDNFNKIIHAFDDKKISLEYFRNLSYIENGDANSIAILVNYVSSARQYYVDDRALLASSLELIKTADPLLIRYGDTEELEKIVEQKQTEDKKANGIYNLDQAALAELDYKLNELSQARENLVVLLQSADSQIAILRSEIEKNKAELTQAKIKELSDLSEKANQIIKNFNASYLELLNQQRESLINEKDLLMADVNSELEKKKTELLNMADGIEKRISLELNRITNAGNTSMQNLRDFVQNSQEIKKMIKNSKADDELMKRLIEFEEIASKLSPAAPEFPKTAAKKKETSASQVVVTPTIIVPNDINREVNPTVNYYFDTNIPFQDRFSRLMELKQKDIEENDAIYHEKFDDVLKFVMQGKTPYMWGPSGCGKTYMIEVQLSNLLGIPVLTNGYVLYEQDVIGYTNSATGDYVPNNFYRCFKFGDIIFFDELDAGIANATVVLNRFIGNHGMYYSFPDGISLQRHPNFRIIAAGNTTGNGKTVAHNTRQKMDESVLQRLIPIEVSYDNRIEMRILKDYPAWYNFAVNFRKAVEKSPSEIGEVTNTIGTFTTRDADSIKLYLDNQSFNDKEIMEYEILQTKDLDYLSQIESELQRLDEQGQFTSAGKKLLKLFSKGVNDRRER